VTHQIYCKQTVHSDAAKRISDTYSMHRLADPIGSVRHWFAVALADGTSDNTVYDTRLEALTHQHHNEYYYFFIQIVPGMLNECDAELMLSGARKMQGARNSLMDRDHPAGGLEPINRLSAEDQMAQLRGKPTNLIIPGRYQN
jgi:hypothetical protein